MISAYSSNFETFCIPVLKIGNIRLDREGRQNPVTTGKVRGYYGTDLWLAVTV